MGLVRFRWLAALAALAGCAEVRCSAADAPFTVEPGPAVLRFDFPDPFLIPGDGGYYAYATNDTRREVNVQLAWSPDLKKWSLLQRDAMPALPAWAKTGFTWAPEVLKVEGGYVLYFTARHRKSDLQCVGAATASEAKGPFVSAAAEPLACQFKDGGTIDAAPFRDADGQLYLYYKNDGNHPRFRKPTRIYAQRMTPDGLTLVGEPVALLSNDAGWEDHVIEAPTMVRRGGRYVMLYSANDYGWPDRRPQSPYAMGAALCAGPMGPCEDVAGNPVLASQRKGPAGCLSGPGHQAVIEAGGETWLAFHAWDANANCRQATTRRFMHIGRISWNAPTAP